MAEESNELRRINWSACCPFTEIFRTFRMAIQPGKLALAVGALLLLGLWGWFLDTIWSSKHQPPHGELNVYWQVQDIDAWREAVRGTNLAALQAVYAGFKPDTKPESVASAYKDDPIEAVDEVLDEIREGYKKGIQDKKDAEIAAVAQELDVQYRAVEELKPRGIFASFISYETTVVRQLVEAGRTLNFTGGIDAVGLVRGGADASRASGEAGPEDIGVLSCIVLALRGKEWLILEHPLYAALFGIVGLAIMSVFGGAICRMAALNVARDERISPKSALGFSTRKFLGLFTAPLLPLALVLVVGVFLMAGGLIAAIPAVGEIVAGLALPLALLGGFVMALVVIGYLGGGALMWPTIAVEGSDSFDAMSRSYSYVYSRPWRAGFYAAVALVYGSICYLFARFFVLVMLKTTRFFLGVGLMGTSRPGAGSASATKLDVLWPAPTFENLLPPGPVFGAAVAEPAGGVLVRISLLIVALLLCGLLVTFFYCGSTVIYYLLRREVDATDMEDVYLEEDDDDTPLPVGGNVTSAPGGEVRPAPPDAPASSAESDASNQGDGSDKDSG